MNQFIDQCGRTIHLQHSPTKIISLVPSQTELLYYLGLEDEIVGITKFCIHPQKWFLTKTQIGGTKNINLEKIRQLKPDLIIANKEENHQQRVETLATEFPTWISDVKDLDSAFEMINCIGAITNKAENADDLTKNIKQQFSLLTPPSYKIKVAYLIWKDPFMVVGRDTFINSMLSTAGFNNVFADQLRYPIVNPEQILKAGAKYLFLSSEPFPFKEKHVSEFKKLFPGLLPILVDGELFRWYGSRLLFAPAYFNQLIKNIGDNN